MSKVAVIGAVVIIGVGVVGGGGYYYASNKAEQELANAVSLAEKSMPGSSIKYESHSVSPFSQSATLHKVVLKDGKGQEYTADTVIIGGVSNNKVKNISVDKFHTAIEDGVIDVAHADATNVVIGEGAIVVEDGKITKIFPSKVSFDLLNIQNFSAMGPDKTGITVGQYELKNYGLKQKSNQVLKQLELKASADGKEYIKLDQAQIDGLDIAQIAAQIEQHQVPNTLAGQPEKATLEGVSANLEGQTWSLAKFETENSVAANGDLKSSGAFSGFKIGTAHNVKLYPLTQLGYDQIDASGNLSATYDKAKQQWAFAPFNLTINGMGSLTADLKFNGPEDLSGINPQELLSSYKLIALKVVLHDQGLLQKTFENTAKEQSAAPQSSGEAVTTDDATTTHKTVTADQVKQQMIATIKQDAQASTSSVEKQGDEAILQLINDPKKSLVIEMNPATPVTGIELMGKSQAEIFDTLKLNVTTQDAK